MRSSIKPKRGPQLETNPIQNSMKDRVFKMRSLIKSKRGPQLKTPAIEQN
jgi:hypothetical protein